MTVVEGHECLIRPVNRQGQGRHVDTMVTQQFTFARLLGDVGVQTDNNIRLGVLALQQQARQHIACLIDQITAAFGLKRRFN